jgi:hypothetical protein
MDLNLALNSASFCADETKCSMLDHLFKSFSSFEAANQEIKKISALKTFFNSDEEFNDLKKIISGIDNGFTHKYERQWGDFQTPRQLANQICYYLRDQGVSPQIIVEPTCGTGNFIFASLDSFPNSKLIYGVEIQKYYEWALKRDLLVEASSGQKSKVEIDIHNDDIFTHEFPKEVFKSENILIIGNPPWVTNAELGSLQAINLPKKSNIKSLKGMDALTGKSNFDLGEFVLLRILDIFSNCRGTLAMLCKNIVIKNIIENLPKTKYKVSNIRALEIDAQKNFGATVNASLLVMNLGSSNSDFTCQVSSLDNPDKIKTTFGWVGNKFVSNVEDYKTNSDLDGISPMEWRQGVKHDCSKIMELDAKEDSCINGKGEIVDVESEWTYWLLKSSDIRSFKATPRKKVIITQNKIGEDTSKLQQAAPNLWRYLSDNAEYLDKRKSSIYRNKPKFSIFGIGEYSFKQYKVATSGMYKKPNFSLVSPIENRPMMLDDTCYFIGFNSYSDALFTASILNMPKVLNFLASIVFEDAKRPYTKDTLMRIDLGKAANETPFSNLKAFWDEIGYVLEKPVTESDFEAYKKRFHALRSFS